MKNAKNNAPGDRNYVEPDDPTLELKRGDIVWIEIDPEDDDA